MPLTFFFTLIVLEYPLFRDTVGHRYKFVSQFCDFKSSLFFLSIDTCTHFRRTFSAPYNPSFGISLTRSLLNLYTSRTCINIMLLLNLSCVFTRMPRCGSRHSCRLDLLCNPSLCVGSTYTEMKSGNDLEKNAMRTERLFALRSPSGTNLYNNAVNERADRRQRNSLSNISRMT